MYTYQRRSESAHAREHASTRASGFAPAPPMQRVIGGPQQGQPQATVRVQVAGAGGGGFPATTFGFANGDTVDMLAAHIRRMYRGSVPANYNVHIELNGHVLLQGTALVNGQGYYAVFTAPAPAFESKLFPGAAPTGGSGGGGGPADKIGDADAQHALGSLLNALG